MRYILLILVFGFMACKSSIQEQNNDTDPDLLSTELIKDGESLTSEDHIEYAEMTFETNRWKFGQIKQRESVEQTFYFKNTGKTPLIISSAFGSCGCTVPTWPKEPIEPGEKGEIHVQFNSGTKKGKQSKQVTITANTKPNITQLFVEGEILIN